MFDIISRFRVLAHELINTINARIKYNFGHSIFTLI